MSELLPVRQADVSLERQVTALHRNLHFAKAVTLPEEDRKAKTYHINFMARKCDEVEDPNQAFDESYYRTALLARVSELLGRPVMASGRLTEINQGLHLVTEDTPVHLDVSREPLELTFSLRGNAENLWIEHRRGGILYEAPWDTMRVEEMPTPYPERALQTPDGPL